MLRNEIEKNEMFIQMSELVSPLGFKVVDAVRNESAAGVQLHLTVYCEDHEINTDDLAAVYNVVYPRYSVLWTRDLELEVSSPGINRNIKDIGEFKIFLGKTVRVYVQSKSSYVVGKIEKADDDYLYLSSYLIEDTKEEGEEIRIEYSDISKAKLDYVTEAKGK